MAIHKLQIDDFVMVDYKLIAIHSPLEDYRLAYFLNNALRLRLEKDPVDIGIKIHEGESCFSRFIFTDNHSEITWNFIQNQNRVVSQQMQMVSLFEDTGYALTTRVFLIPEFKTVDYILKMENTPDDFNPEAIVNTLQKVKHINTAYTIDQNKLKSKNNLIF